MKLVEILANELDVWPEGVVSYAQDDTEIVGASDGMQHRPHNSRCWSPTPGNYWVQDAPLNGEPVELSSDYQTAIVTKEMWEAEKAKLNAQNTPVFNPIYCRDRIKEIDSLVESLEEERVSLVQALKDEGFALVNTVRVSPKVSSVAPVGDMSDWRNWKVGDHLEVTSNLTAHGFGIGEVVKIGSLDEGGKGMTLYCLNDSDFWFADHNEVKFHSRPQQ